MIDAAFAQAFETTWPAADYADCGGFRVGLGQGAGGRVSSARPAGAWAEDDIDKVEAQCRAWHQPALFRVMSDDSALQDALISRGYFRQNPTTLMVAPIKLLTAEPLPPLKAFAVWPPMAIQREVWAEAGRVDPSRQAVMDRAPEPKAALLGRVSDRAAGAGFVAVADGVAMVHAMEVLPDRQRQGVAGWMMRQVAFWAADHGATRVGLAVADDNVAALATYRRLGFEVIGNYAYYGKPA